MKENVLYIKNIVYVCVCRIQNKKNSHGTAKWDLQAKFDDERETEKRMNIRERESVGKNAKLVALKLLYRTG